MKKCYTEKRWIAERIDDMTYQLAHDGVHEIEKCGKIYLRCCGFEVSLRPCMILDEWDFSRISKILHEMNIDREKGW